MTEDWSKSADYRHQCEVRQILLLRQQDRNKMMNYLDCVLSARGKEAAKRLEDDARAQWVKGNRGGTGVWHD